MKTERVTGILSFLGRFLCFIALTIEVSAQTQPLIRRSQWPGCPSSWRVAAALSGDCAYVVGTPGFHVFNVSNPAQPQLTGYLDGINSGWGGNAIEVVPPCAYFANSLGSFKVIDISQPTNPTLIGACTIAVSNG